MFSFSSIAGSLLEYKETVLMGSMYHREGLPSCQAALQQRCVSGAANAQLSLASLAWTLIQSAHARYSFSNLSCEAQAFLLQRHVSRARDVEHWDMQAIPDLSPLDSFNDRTHQECHKHHRRCHQSKCVQHSGTTEEPHLAYEEDQPDTACLVSDAQLASRINSRC